MKSIWKKLAIIAAVAVGLAVADKYGIKQELVAEICGGATQLPGVPLE